MRAFFPLSGLAACLILSTIALTDTAAQLAAQAPRPRPKPPGVRNAPIAFKRPLDPAVAKILWNWHFANFNIGRFDANFSYVRYDGSLEVETIGQGLVSVDREGRAPRQPSSRISRANGASYQVPHEPVADPALDVFLRDWHAANSKIDRIDVKFTYVSYDSLFATERIGTGFASVDRAMRGFYKIVPDNRSQGRHGARYVRMPVRADRWHFTGDSLIKVDESDRTIERIDIPTNLSRQYGDIATRDRPSAPALPEDIHPVSPNWFFNSHPLEGSLSQFLIIGPPEKLRERFQISIEKQSETDVRLKFVPKTSALRAHFHAVFLIIKRNDHLPYALKCIDPTQNFEVVYIATEVRCNLPLTDPFEDLGSPNLQGYKEVVQPAMSLHGKRVPPVK